MATDQQRVIHRPAGTAPATWAMGSLFERLARPGETGGLDLALVTRPPGIATPLHRHTREAEAFFLDGTMTYRAGEETFRLAAGDFLYLPAGIPHAFRVTGSVPVREHRLPGPDGQSPDIEIPKMERRGASVRPRGRGSPLAGGTRARLIERPASAPDGGIELHLRGPAGHVR